MHEVRFINTELPDIIELQLYRHVLESAALLRVATSPRKITRNSQSWRL